MKVIGVIFLLITEYFQKKYITAIPVTAPEVLIREGGGGGEVR